MAVVTVRRGRIRVSPSSHNPVVKIVEVPPDLVEDAARIVFLVTQDFIDAYRSGAA